MKHAFSRAEPVADRSRDALIGRGLNIVRRIAFRMSRRLTPNVQVGDLISAGTEGLLRAVDRYDVSRARPFEAYVEPCIRGAILDELRASDAMTRHGRKRLRQITEAIGRLEQQLGRTPTGEEVADALGIELETYWSLMADFARTPLLAHRDLGDDRVATGAQDPVSLLEERELREALVAAIGRLPERMQRILALYYQEECTLAEIGLVLGISESRVCQILGEAASRLRATLTTEGV